MQEASFAAQWPENPPKTEGPLDSKMCWKDDVYFIIIRGVKSPPFGGGGPLNIMELLKTLYEVLGSSWPRLSITIAALIGAIVFGGSWWLIGKQYEKEQAQSAPSLPTQTKITANSWTPFIKVNSSKLPPTADHIDLLVKLADTNSSLRIAAESDGSFQNTISSNEQIVRQLIREPQTIYISASRKDAQCAVFVKSWHDPLSNKWSQFATPLLITRTENIPLTEKEVREPPGVRKFSQSDGG